MDLSKALSNSFPDLSGPIDHLHQAVYSLTKYPDGILLSVANEKQPDNTTKMSIFLYDRRYNNRPI